MDVGSKSVEQTRSLLLLSSLSVHGAVDIPRLSRRSGTESRSFGPVLLLGLLLQLLMRCRFSSGGTGGGSIGRFSLVDGRSRR